MRPCSSDLAAAVCAAAFLAGCTGGPPEDTASSAATASPAQFRPERPDSGTQYSADQLEVALASLNKSESLQGTIITDAEIRPALETAAEEGALGEITVTPAECDIFADTELTGLAAEANLAVMTFAGGSSLQPDSLTLSSQASVDAIREQINANRTQLARCSEFTMEVSGEVLTARVTELGAATEADETFAAATRVKRPGSIQETISVTGIIGTTSVAVTVGSSRDRTADVERAVGLVNGAIAELKEL